MKKINLIIYTLISVLIILLSLKTYKHQDWLFINAKELIIPFTKKPTVSVVIPSYHMGKYLPNSINSIINQTYKDWEAIIIDDGSLDNTQKILRQYRFNHKIRIIKNPYNTGLTNSLNKGLKLSRGKYIARLDVDDYSYPDRLERQVSLMEKENLDLLAHTFNIKDNEITYFKENFNTYDIGLHLLIKNEFCHSSVMIRKSFLQKYNLTYTNNYDNAEDYELWIKIFLNGGKIAWIGGRPIVIYNPSPHFEYWFRTQRKSRDKIRAWAISQIIPNYNDKMLNLKLCQLVPILIKGNKQTHTLNQQELEKYYNKNCLNLKK